MLLIGGLKPKVEATFTKIPLVEEGPRLYVIVNIESQRQLELILTLASSSVEASHAGKAKCLFD